MNSNRYGGAVSRCDSEMDYARSMADYRGTLTASEAASPIAASMKSLHKLSAEALEAVSRLEERLSPVLHEPRPETEADVCGQASTCSMHDELLSISRRIEDTIGRVNRLMARLAL